MTPKRAIAWLSLLMSGAVFAAPAADEPAAPAPAAGPAVVYTIPIRGMIEPALLYVIRRGVQEAESARADAIIFIMDTPGGTVDSAGEIVRTIQNLSIPTYTFVEKNAFSAGAIIALATRHIYMAPGSVIGDAMPIMVSPFGGVQEMSEDVKEKAVSGVAALVRSAAQSGGHDQELAEKMVRRELEFKIKDEVISPKGQLLTLTNVEAEREIGKKGERLLSDGTVKDVPELLAKIGLGHAAVRELNVTAAEKVARFIAAFAPLFLMAGLLGIYIEIKTPGFGLPGILGIIALAIFFWGHHIAGLAGLEDVVIFFVGLVLLLIELLFIPGFGVVGITGIALMFFAVLNAMISHYPGTSWVPAWPDVQVPLFKLSASLVGTAVVAVYLARYLPSTPVFKRLVLQSTTSRRDGFAAGPADSASLLGREGTTLSALRPAGAASIGDRKVDVVTRGDFIEKGAVVRVVEAHGSRIVVEPVARGPRS